jgi:membrane protein YdbS with pleckstrin-like domain
MMRHCTNCGATLAPGVRFCGACGAPVAAADATHSSMPVGKDEMTQLADEDATRLAPDGDATRVAARSPFDDQQRTPARVERLNDLSNPVTPPNTSAQQPGYDLRAPQTPQPDYDPRTSLPGYDQRMAQPATSRRGTQVSAQGASGEDSERVVFALRPTMLFIGVGYALAALCAIGLTILLAKFNLLSAFHSLLVSLPLLLVPAYYHLRRNTIKYTLTDSKIEIDRGLIARRTRNIPLRNIQDVTVAATIPQRILGFGDLIIDNASELGGSTVMHNIPAPRRHADLLLRELRRWH